MPATRTKEARGHGPLHKFQLFSGLGIHEQGFRQGD